MTIYRIEALADEYDGLIPHDHDHVEFVRRAGHGRRGADWRPLAVTVFPAMQGPRRGDFASLPVYGPALGQRALDVLLPLIGPSVEVLPLACAEEPWFILNVLDVVPALDLERSEVDRYSDGTIMFVARPVLRRAAVEGRTIFRMAESPLEAIFVSDEVKARIEEHGLTGLRLVEVESA